MLVFNLFSFSFWSTTGCFSTSVNFNFWRRSRMKCIFEIAGALNASKCCVFCAKTSRQGMSRKERCQERNVTGKRCHGKEVCQEKAASRKNKVSGKEMSTERAVWRKRHVSQMCQGKRDARSRKFQQLSRLEQLALFFKQLQCCKGTEGALEALDCFGSTGPHFICTALLRSSKLNQGNRICLAAVIAAVLRRGC